MSVKKALVTVVFICIPLSVMCIQLYRFQFYQPPSSRAFRTERRRVEMVVILSLLTAALGGVYLSRGKDEGATEGS